MLLITDLMSHFCSHLHRTGAVRFKADSLITKFQNLGTAEGVSTSPTIFLIFGFHFFLSFLFVCFLVCFLFLLLLFSAFDFFLWKVSLYRPIFPSEGNVF